MKYDLSVEQLIDLQSSGELKQGLHEM